MMDLQDQEVEGGQVESIKDELLGAGDVVLVEVGSHAALRFRSSSSGRMSSQASSVCKKGH